MVMVASYYYLSKTIVVLVQDSKPCLFKSVYEIHYAAMYIIIVLPLKFKIKQYVYQL